MIKNIKVLVLGDSYSGKTTLIKKMVGQSIKNINITLGIDFFQKKSKDTLIQMYDAGGNAEIFKMISTYLRNVDLIILTYDLNNNNNYKSICKWLDIINIFSKPILLIGNKKDLKNYTPKIPKDILDKHNILGHEEISCFNSFDYLLILNFLEKFLENKYIDKKNDEKNNLSCLPIYF